MSFKQFIRENENDQRDDLIKLADTIKKECQPYLKETNGKLVFDLCLWRGIKNIHADGIYDVRKDRLPKDTKPVIHDLMDEYFVKNFGTSFRKAALFATGDAVMAHVHGPTHAIFPIGKYSYIWSKRAHDIFTILPFELSSAIIFLTNRKEQNKITDKEEQQLKDSKEKFMEWMDGMDYNDDGLLRGIETGCEIMIACDKYIAVPRRDVDLSDDVFFKYLYGKVGKDAF